MEVHGQLRAPADVLLVKKLNKYMVPIEWARWVPELVCMLEKRKIAMRFVCSLVCV